MKDRLKLIRNFIIISLPLIILCLLAFLLPMSYMSVEYVMWDEEFENSEKPYIDAKTVIIGDSRAKSSVLPALLHEDTYNIAIGGATPIEMYYAVKNYIDRNGAPENAVVIFAPYHFCDIDNWDQTLYFNFLTAGEIGEIYFKALETGDPIVAKKGRIPDMISYRLRLPSKYLAQMYEARFTGNKEANMKKFDSIRADLGYCEFGSADGDDGETHEVYHETFDYSPLVVYYYGELIKLLAENNVNLLIAQPPINEASGKAIHKEFTEGYAACVEEAASDYPQINVITEIPVYDNSLFGDSIHVNRKGAEAYTVELREYMESIDFWKQGSEIYE
ncbi:MAG: hypothetical protein K6G42_11560 [Lachnospiraceae bacterium]|nr:hypothetical protein [Lachnospiraceae bacterium]